MHQPISAQHRNKVTALLSVNELYVYKNTDPDWHVYVPSLKIKPGEWIVIHGENGSGKSLIAQTLAGLYRRYACRNSSGILYQRENILDYSPKKLSQLHNQAIAYMPQYALSALNPQLKLKEQLLEKIHLNPHCKDPCAAYYQALEDATITPSQEHWLDKYPHELSGGQRQQLLLAITIANRPKLLILDEPTASLDLQRSEELLQKLHQYTHQHHSGIIVITHQPEKIQGHSHSSYQINNHVLEQEQIIHNSTEALTAAKAMKLQKPSTSESANTKSSLGAALVSSIPVQASSRNHLLNFNCPKTIPHQHNDEQTNITEEINQLSWQLFDNECMGFSGKNGTGKSTLAKLLAHRDQNNSDLNLHIHGPVVSQLCRRKFAKHIQLVQQDAASSLTPHLNIQTLLHESIRLHFPNLSLAQQQQQIHQHLAMFNLPPSKLQALPQQLSGGEQQTVAILRAILIQPRILILDEATTAMHPQQQRQILDYINSQQEHLHGWILISHNRELLKRYCQRILHLPSGRIEQTTSPASNPNN